MASFAPGEPTPGGPNVPPPRPRPGFPGKVPLGTGFPGKQIPMKGPISPGGMQTVPRPGIPRPGQPGGMFPPKPGGPGQILPGRPGGPDLSLPGKPLPMRPGGIRPGMQPKGSPSGINPYRNQKGITPELLAQMARRRLGG